MGLETAFAKVIKRIRQAHGLSQEEVAFEAGLDRTYISLLERGKRQPTLSTIFALSEALKTNPSHLVREVEREYKRIEDEPIK